MEREYVEKEFVREIFDCYGAIVNHFGRPLRWVDGAEHEQLDYVNVSSLPHPPFASWNIPLPHLSQNDLDRCTLGPTQDRRFHRTLT